MSTEQREIDKLYEDHLDSLRLSGLEFNETEVFVEWDKALIAAGYEAPTR